LNDNALTDRTSAGGQLGRRLAFVLGFVLGFVAGGLAVDHGRGGRAEGGRGRSPRIATGIPSPRP
jgi:hypothetical protein